MVKVVNKGLKVEIFPDKDMKHVLNQNIGNARFIWNNFLARYGYLYQLFCFHGYPLNLVPFKYLMLKKSINK